MTGSTARIDTTEAAARLGVKRETLYAYVSRGLIASERDPRRKTSTFDPAEIERLIRRRSDSRPGRLEVLVSSAITEVTNGRVAYRGHALENLTAAGCSYEAVAELLWTGDLRPVEPWTPVKPVRKAVHRAASVLPANATPIDRMMAGVIAAGALDPFRDDRTLDGVARVGRGVIRAVVDSFPALVEIDDHSLAHRLWARLTSEAPDAWPLLERALIGLADHGMATSTLGARLSASTRAGPHAVLLSALGAVAGPLHGAASRRVHLLLADAERSGAEAAIAGVMRREGRVPGVGHVIHKTRDPRFDLLFDVLMESDLDRRRMEVVDDVVSRITGRMTEKPNVDLALGALTYAAGMGQEAGELIFAIARAAGWLAHCLEEYGEAPLRFRPVGRYRGP